MEVAARATARVMPLEQKARAGRSYALPHRKMATRRPLTAVKVTIRSALVRCHSQSKCRTRCCHEARHLRDE